MTGPFLLSISVFIFSFFIVLFCLVPCGRFSWLYVSFWAHVNIIVSYRIVLTVAGDDVQMKEVAASTMSSVVIQRHTRRRTLDVRHRRHTRAVQRRLRQTDTHRTASHDLASHESPHLSINSSTPPAASCHSWPTLDQTLFLGSYSERPSSLQLYSGLWLAGLSREKLWWDFDEAIFRPCLPTSGVKTL